MRRPPEGDPLPIMVQPVSITYRPPEAEEITAEVWELWT